MIDDVELELWFRRHGFVYAAKRECWCIAWSMRGGYDFTDLEFMRCGTQWEAMTGHHASGTNPRMLLGVCDTLDDIARTTEAVRLINGYPQPEHYVPKLSLRNRMPKRDKSS